HPSDFVLCTWNFLDFILKVLQVSHQSGNQWEDAHDPWELLLLFFLCPMKIVQALVVKPPSYLIYTLFQDCSYILSCSIRSHRYFPCPSVRILLSLDPKKPLSFRPHHSRCSRRPPINSEQLRRTL